MLAGAFDDVKASAELAALAGRFHPEFFAAPRLCQNLKETGEHGRAGLSR